MRSMICLRFRYDFARHPFHMLIHVSRRFPKFQSNRLPSYDFNLLACDMSNYLAKVVLAFVLSAFTLASAAQATKSLPALKDFAKFPIGVALNVGNELGDMEEIAEHSALITAQFSSIVAENGMKMSYLHPELNTFNFLAADALTKYALDHGMVMHGHTLIWHNEYQFPEWLKTYEGDWSTMLREHVQTICKHFAGKVKSWDVVNEAIENKRPWHYRETPFFNKLGPVYIEQAFIAAHEADPNAVLYYNDFAIESRPEKLQFMLAMIDDFQRRHIPIHGIGFQMHLSVDGPPITQIRDALQAVVARGLQVRISEMDVSVNQKHKAANFDPAWAELQKARYKEVISTYLQTVPPAQRAGISFWGLLDKDSWLVESKPHPDWPLLFDGEGQAKPAFWGVLEALREAQ